MMRVFSLMPDCKQITMLIVKEQEVKLSLKEKFDMHLHLIICKFCKAFRIQTRLLDAHIHKLAHDESPLPVNHMLSAQKKEAIQQAIDKELGK